MVHPKVFLVCVLAGCILLLALPGQTSSLGTLNAQVVDLKFYEQPYDEVPYDQRVYKESFAQANTRYVAYEIHFQNPAPGRSVQIPLTIQYIKPDGSLMGEFARTITVEADWTAWWHAGSWGWREAGNWTPGEYTVRFLEGDTEIATGQFSISQQSEDTNGFTGDTWVNAFYVAYWNRAGDPDGIAYWTRLIENKTLDATGVAENFALSVEAKDAYPYFQAPEQATDQDRSNFILAVYRNLLNQDLPADDEGVRYWVEELRTGRSSPGAVIGHIIYAALVEDGVNWQTISNKVAVSQYFSDTFQARSRKWTFADMGRARDCLAGVTDQSPTVPEAKAYVDHLLTGSLLESADGAYVDFPDIGPDQMTDMEFTVSADPRGQEVDGSLIISKEYSLYVDWQNISGKNLLTAIPLDPSLLNEVSDEDLFTVEYLDPTSNTWVSLAAMTYIALQEGILYVDLPLQKIIQQQVYFSTNVQQKALQSSQDNMYPSVKLRASRMQFRPRPISWISEKKVQFQDSPFVIFYHDAGPNKILTDSDWNGTGKTHLDSFGNNVPEYIGDLHQALSDTYAALLRLVDGHGNQLFSPNGRIAVYVRKMKEAGNADIGGPLQCNIRMDDYQEMLWTVAHEMVHVLQGEYYTGKGLFTGRQNRWFIEATAQYFGALALGLSQQEKADFYPSGYSTDYLSVPLTDNNEGSFYLLGHFLDWLSRTYSTTVVQDTLGSSWGSDQRALSKQLVDGGCSGGLEEAFARYLRYVLTNPEKEGKLNGQIKSTMANYSLGYGLLSPGGLMGESRTFVTYLHALRPLSAGYVNLSAQRSLTKSSLMVVEAALLPSSLERMTYDFEGTSSSQYQGVDPVDKNHDYAAGTLGLKDFRYNGQVSGMEQLIYNTLNTVIPFEMNYYILVAPEILEIQDGAVLWDTSTAGNIPSSYIQGYNVYKDSVQLNRSIVPYSSDSQSLSHSGIQKQSTDLVVQIVDKHGNKWPAVAERPVDPSGFDCGWTVDYAQLRKEDDMCMYYSEEEGTYEKPCTRYYLDEGILQGPAVDFFDQARTNPEEQICRLENLFHGYRITWRKDGTLEWKGLYKNGYYIAHCNFDDAGAFIGGSYRDGKRMEDSCELPDINTVNTTGYTYIPGTDDWRLKNE